MRKALGKHTSTVVVAVVTAALTAAAPSVAAGVRAAFASNSDKVDGIHAVTAKQAAKLKARKGKLVATDLKTGLLPASIVPVPGNVANATHAATADSATSATSAASATDSTTVGGLTAPQITKTYARALSTGVAANTLTIPVPVDGIVTWHASCYFLTGGAATVNMTSRSYPTGSPSGSAVWHKAVTVNDPGNPSFFIATVAFDDFTTVAAGTSRTIEVANEVAGCQNGRLVATYTSQSQVMA